MTFINHLKPNENTFFPLNIIKKHVFLRLYKGKINSLKRFKQSKK